MKLAIALLAMSAFADQPPVTVRGCSLEYAKRNPWCGPVVQRQDQSHIRAYEEHVRREIKRADPKAERP